MPLINFNDEEWDFFRQMFRWFQQQEVESRPVVDDTDIGGAPEVYIARGSLPALTQNAVTGTGTGSADEDTPGTASLPLYRISPTTGLPEALGISRTIYNFGGAIAGEWIPVIKHKCGKWLASYVCGE